MSILGTRVVRVEDPKLITTGGVYTEDLQVDELRGAAHLTFVRSPLAHARITSIDTTAARAMPGVVAVYTIDDLRDLDPIRPGIPLFNAEMIQAWLADGVVRFVGEPVAMVLTQTRGEGEDAAEAVEVEYEPLPAVIGAANAAQDRTLLFPAAGTNVVATFGEPVPDGFFDGCEVVVRQPVLNQRLAPAPLEVRAAAAAWGDDGRLRLWASNQNAQAVKRDTAAWLGVDAERVHLRTADVGGGFGAKIGADPAFALVAKAAQLAGRPVRWVESRSESLTGMVHGRAQENVLTVGGTRDGRVTHYALEVIQDAGAYPRLGAILPSLTLMMQPAVYDIAHVHGYARSVATNTTPTGAYRGAGRPEATHAAERAMDLFAAEIGMDPVEVRRKNLLAAFDSPHDNGSGATYDSGDYAAALEKAVQGAGLEALRAEQKARRDRGDAVQLGIGVSCYVEITGAGLDGLGEDAQVEVHGDGTVTVLTGTSPHGQGHATAWAMIVSDQTGIPVERITVIHGDTDLVPRGGGTLGSRSLQQGGAAVFEATAALVDIARKLAAEELEANPDDIVVDTANGTLGVAGTTTSVTFGELAAKHGLVAQKTFTAAAPTFPFGTHVAVVEVDTLTGQARLVRIVTVDDAGRVLNPLLCDGQRHGGIAQGVAQALYEEVLYDEDGNPLTATLAHYPFISATEVPSYELLTMETETPYNPLGAKGIGEAGTIGATPAVLSAVVDAVAHLGVRHIDMPAAPHRVWQAIQDADKERA